jgi:hypothetical protein
VEKLIGKPLANARAEFFNAMLALDPNNNDTILVQLARLLCNQR